MLYQYGRLLESHTDKPRGENGTVSLLKASVNHLDVNFIWMSIPAFASLVMLHPL